jgi:cysteinyl-tRNA synthetase
VTVRLYDSKAQALRDFVPLREGHVGMYVCGPTVQSSPHIGHLRSALVYDIMRRWFSARGTDVTFVRNVTDIDDKILQAAGNEEWWALAYRIELEFTSAYASLGILAPTYEPRATASVQQMVELIARLIERGHTYTVEGSIYFRIASDPSYGKLARLDVEGIKAGARVDTDKYDKENARDFVLWKVKSDEPAWAQWEAPFGRGRPGWHLECSAMSMKYLGETFDLHGGGIDLVFPHHVNEIAQSTCATGKRFVRHWTHVAHLLIENETMSKSKGNVFLIPDLLAKGHRADTIRYSLIAAHYRSQLNFTWDGLGHAAAALDRVRSFLQRLSEVDAAGPASPAVEDAIQKARTAFDAALDEDLNTPEALSAVHVLVGEGNALLAAGEVGREGAARLRATLESLDAVLGVLLPPGEDRLRPEEQALFDERQEARRSRDFQRADEARARLDALGIILEDGPKGTRWRRKR